LVGLKENVILGRLIPAGTGYKPEIKKILNYKKINSSRNLSILADKLSNEILEAYKSPDSFSKLRVLKEFNGTIPLLLRPLEEILNKRGIIFCSYIYKLKNDILYYRRRKRFW
tara:strand:- start:195 stop:533 length:339 start_codon:yes stop_codon:yes gene_type:complete